MIRLVVLVAVLGACAPVDDPVCSVGQVEPCGPGCAVGALRANLRGLRFCVVGELGPEWGACRCSGAR